MKKTTSLLILCVALFVIGTGLVGFLAVTFTQDIGYTFAQLGLFWFVLGILFVWQIQKQDKASLLQAGIFRRKQLAVPLVMVMFGVLVFVWGFSHKNNQEPQLHNIDYIE